MFRGGELPKLLFLVAIVLAGWPMFVIFARPQEPDKPANPPLKAEDLKPIVPDDSIEFQALVDKAPIRVRETAAYAKLLERTRATPPETLAAEARRDVFYTHLWENPKHYRGIPIHLEGTVKKVLTHEVGEGMTPKKRLFEAWMYSDEDRNGKVPYVVVFEDAPKGLTIGHEVHLRVAVDAYFMKLLGYNAGDTLRAAPMLVGRLRWLDVPAASPPMVQLREWTKRDGLIIVAVLLVVYLAFRLLLQVGRFLGPARDRDRERAKARVVEEAPAGKVDDWLKDLPDEDLGRAEG